MAGDRDINLNKGNYNERIERDYLDNSISGNIGANTIIQNANNVVIKIGKDSETIKSKAERGRVLLCFELAVDGQV